MNTLNENGEAVENDELLTVQEAAARAGLTEMAIRQAILRNRLPETVKYGRKLIKASDLAAYQARAKRGRPSKHEVKV